MVCVLKRRPLFLSIQANFHLYFPSANWNILPSQDPLPHPGLVHDIVPREVAINTTMNHNCDDHDIQRTLANVIEIRNVLWQIEEILTQWNQTLLDRLISHVGS